MKAFRLILFDRSGDETRLSWIVFFLFI